MARGTGGTSLPQVGRRQRKSSNLSDYVRESLREAILTLALPPGSVIDKTAVCEQLGVSRSPVTDALSRLQDEGLVEVRARSGTVVSWIRIHEVEQAAFIRRALEVEAVRAIAPTASAELVRKLTANLAYSRSSVAQGDKRGFHELDLQFHEVLLDELGYPRVRSAVETWRGSLDRARRLNAPERDQSLILSEHSRIASALEGRKAAAAAEAMRSHLDAGMQALTGYMQAHSDLFR